MSELKSIPDGWVETTLGEIAFINMGQSPSGETCNQNDKGLPLLNGPTEYGEIHPFPIQYTIDPRKTSEMNDLLFCVRGSTTGRMNWSNQVYAIGRGIAAIRHKKGEEYRKFIKGIFDYNLQKLLAEATGSTFPNVSRNQLENIEILLPPLEEQKSIASILNSFDDKIELLKAQNKTLEATAQTIFAEWFGKYSIDDEFPEDWRVGKLCELVQKISKGTTATKDDLIGLDGEIPFLKVKDISNDGLILKNNLELIPKSVHENQLKRSILETNDILFSIAGTIGRLAIVDSEMNNVNCNQALAFIRLKDKYTYLEYIHLWLKSKETQDVIISNIVQGVQANVSLTVLGNLLLLIPNSETIINWGNLIKPIYLKLQTNTEQIQTLSKTRDELLPRLMSGELRVKM